ncbi:MAG TPA: SpoIIE family protein phosphatase [Thermoanaerobaculia bacterium]|jgi:sigma-B regulation protein RsbU (phosphoserine phosphatase)|nr:SpoIIE family protein phosphatase [Thermoanaerobaculia bacterium]
MLDQDRRRAERILLSSPITGHVAECAVCIVDIGFGGMLIEHDGPLMLGPQTLRFDWDGADMAVDCTIIRTVPSGAAFRSGLQFSDRDLPLMRRIVSTLTERDEMDRLRTLVEASKLINSSIDPGTLFASILTVARKELHVERGTLYFVDEQKQEIWTKIAGELSSEIRLPIGKGLAGTVAATGQPLILHDAYDDPRFDRSLDQKTGYRTRSMLCVPIRNRGQRIVGVLQLLNKTTGLFGPRDLEFLSDISDHMAIAMENATLHMELLEKQRMEQELALGREIQGQLLPSAPVDVHGVELAALSLPCYEVGGDYFDFIELPDGDLGLAIGDVSGKGVSAALIMSSVQAALRVAAPIESDLARLVARLNALIFRGASGRKYATFFFGRYTPSTGLLRYVNAGHNPPYLVTADGVTAIGSTGRPIGILPESSYTEGTIELPQGSTLFLYTDGLNEAADPSDTEFGDDQLRALFLAQRDAATESIPSRVLNAITAFERGARATDDKTIVVMRRG